jgi:hypothetical protein
VVVGAHWRQTAQLREDVVELAKVAVQQGLVRCCSHCTSRRLPIVVTGGVEALPQDVPRAPREGHAQVLEVPEDMAEHAEEVDAEDDNKTVEVDAEATDGELFYAPMASATSWATPSQGTPRWPPRPSWWDVALLIGVGGACGRHR